MNHDEMTTGERIFDVLCDTCKEKAEKIIREDGVVNRWDDMLKDDYKSRRSDVQW